MRLFEFVCKECSAEVVSSTHDHHLKNNCDSCGGQLRKVWPVPGIRFVGPGFYKTSH